MTNQTLEYYTIKPQYLPSELASWGMYVRSGTWPSDREAEHWDLKAGRIHNDRARDARLFDELNRQDFSDKTLTHRQAAAASALHTS